MLGRANFAFLMIKNHDDKLLNDVKKDSNKYRTNKMKENDNDSKRPSNAA